MIFLTKVSLFFSYILYHAIQQSFTNFPLLVKNSLKLSLPETENAENVKNRLWNFIFLMMMEKLKKFCCFFREWREIQKFHKLFFHLNLFPFCSKKKKFCSKNFHSVFGSFCLAQMKNINFKPILNTSSHIVKTCLGFMHHDRNLH